MKKKTKKLIVAAVLLLVVLGLLVLVLKLTKEEEKQPKEVKPVSQTAVKDIEGLTYISESTSGEAVSLIRENNIWYYEKDKDFPLDQEYVTNNMVLTAAEATANRTVENAGGNPKDYGLDQPIVTVILKKITGDEVTMRIGSYNENVEGYYLQVEGDENLYLVDGQIAFAFDMSIYEIADKEDYPYVEEDSYTHVKIEKGSTSVEFKSVIDEDANKVVNDYYLEAPKSWQVAKNGGSYKEGNQDAVKELLTQLSILDYASMIAYRGDDKLKDSYGLGENAVVLTVDYEVLDENTAKEVEGDDGITEIVCDTIEKQYVLRIGKQLPEDGFSEPEYYVCMDESDVIYTMTVDALESIVNINADNYK